MRNDNSSLFVFITVICFFIGIFISSRRRFYKKIEKSQMELNKLDTVYIQKINDTTFQKRNITYIIR